MRAQFIYLFGTAVLQLNASCVILMEDSLLLGCVHYMARADEFKKDCANTGSDGVSAVLNEGSWRCLGCSGLGLWVEGLGGCLAFRGQAGV